MKKTKSIERDQKRKAREEWISCLICFVLSLNLFINKNRVCIVISFKTFFSFISFCASILKFILYITRHTLLLFIFIINGPCNNTELKSRRRKKLKFLGRHKKWSNRFNFFFCIKTTIVQDHIHGISETMTMTTNVVFS